MNMTGDPNQRNKSSMFGFECSYPSPAVGFPRFGDRAPNLSSSMPSETSMMDPTQCLFSTNSSSPFPMNNSVPFTPSYLFPSTSSAPCSSSSFSFPFGSTSTFPGNSTTQNASPFLNWSTNMKPNFHFPVSSSPASSTTSTFSMRPLTGSFGCKRKTESPPLVPLKQHITEERMAEHMSRLHISSQTPTSTKESEPVRERRLYMCEEMQRLQTESIIPAQILEKVHRPCTALVPWRPPIVPPLSSKENNNNEEEPDNNLMERSDSNIMDMDS